MYYLIVPHPPPLLSGEFLGFRHRMWSALLPDLGTEIVIPVCAVVGIVFSLFQWYLVSRVKVSSERGATSPSNNNKNGYGDYLIEEEEGINDQNVIAKCADIQNAISEGEMISSYTDLFIFLSDLAALVLVYICSFPIRKESVQNFAWCSNLFL